MKRGCLLVIALALLLGNACASDWPQWRGPSGMGNCPETDLPLSWNKLAGQNVLWKAPLPKSDMSQSSPIVVSGKVIVTTSKNLPPEHHVTCYAAADGKQLWDQIVPTGPWILSDLRGGYTCATPAADGERVYALFGSAVLAALKLQDGTLVWRKEISPRNFDVAIASSPVLYKGMVILLCDQNAKTSFIAAYDGKSGELKWTQNRPEEGFSHTTPLIADVAGKTQLILGGSGLLQGFDAASGTPIWSCKFSGDVSTPVLGGGLVYCDSGRGGAGIAVDPSGAGDVTDTHVKWTAKTKTNGLNSPAVFSDYLFRISASLVCRKMATGEEVWVERLGGDFNPSPIVTADGKLYYASAGRSWVLKAGDKFELLGESDLADPSSASPAVADGRLFLKGAQNLFCVGKK